MERKYLLSDGRTKTVSPEHEEAFLKALEEAGLTATLVQEQDKENKYSLSDGRQVSVDAEHEEAFQEELKNKNLTAIKLETPKVETSEEETTPVESDENIKQKEIEAKDSNLRDTKRVNPKNVSKGHNMWKHDSLVYGDFTKNENGEWEYKHDPGGDFEIKLDQAIIDELNSIEQMSDRDIRNSRLFIEDTYNGYMFYDDYIYMGGDDPNFQWALKRNNNQFVEDEVTINRLNYIFTNGQEGSFGGRDYGDPDKNYLDYDYNAQLWSTSVLDENGNPTGDILNYRDLYTEKGKKVKRVANGKDSFVDVGDTSLYENNAESFIRQMQTYYGEDVLEFQILHPDMDSVHEIAGATLDALTGTGWEGNMGPGAASQLGLIHDFRRVKVIHKGTGKSVIIDTKINYDQEYKKFESMFGEGKGYFGIDMGFDPLYFLLPGLTTSDQKKDYYYKKSIDENSSKLQMFLNQNLTDDEKYNKTNERLEASIQEIRKQEMKINPDTGEQGALYISDQEVIDAKMKFSVYKKDENGELILDPSGEKIMIMKPGLFDGYRTHNGGFYVPHSETLEQAENFLLAMAHKNNLPDPSLSPDFNEQVQAVAWNLLLAGVKPKLIDEKMLNYMDSIEDGWFSKGTIEQVRAAFRVKEDRDAKALLDFNAMSDKKHRDIVDRFGTVDNPKNELAYKIKIDNLISDPDYIFEIKPGEQYYTFEDIDKKIPKKIWDKYINGLSILKKEQSDLDEWLDENYKVMEGLTWTPYKAELAMKNYNDLDLFWNGLIMDGFEDLFSGGLLAGAKITQYTLDNIVGTDLQEVVDSRIMDHSILNAYQRNRYQKGIDFDDAFSSLNNFGKWFAQEVGQQIPIFVSLGVGGGAGLFAVAGSSGVDNYAQMLQTEMLTGRKTSEHKKFWTSAGYGAAEAVFDRLFTVPMLKRSWAGTFGRQKSLLQGGFRGANDWFKNNWTGFLRGGAQEMAAEGFTSLFQNLITGRPLSENLSHALFSGGMFGVIFGGAPVIKGMFMNAMADTKQNLEFQNNLKQIKKKKQELDKYNRSLKQDPKAKVNKEYIKSLETEIESLGKNNQKILKEVESKVKNKLSKEFTDVYLKYHARSQAITQEAKSIHADKKLNRKQKNAALKVLKAEYNRVTDYMEVMRNSKEFGSKWIALMNSNSDADIERKQKLINDARNRLESGQQLFGDGKKIQNPTDDQISEEARLQYNIEEIRRDYKSKRGKTKLGKSLLSFKTVNEAIDAINKMDISEANKKKLIENILKGGHGSNIAIRNKDGDIVDFIPFQVEENMAKDDRLETRTHELGHTILTEAISENPEAFKEIVEELFDFIQQVNPALYLQLALRTNWGTKNQMPIDEAVVTFFEMVAEGKFDLKSEKNSGIAAMAGFLFTKGTQKATNSDVEFDFEGETDVIRFLTELAKKIKAGEVNQKLREKIKKSKIATEARKKAEKEKKEEKKIKEDAKMSAKADGDVNGLMINPRTSKVYTDEEWKTEGAKRALSELKKNTWLDGLIASKYKARPIPNTWVDDVKNSPEFKNMIDRFNRGLWGTNRQNDSLFGYIQGQLRFRADDVFKLFNAGKAPLGTKSLDAQMQDGPIVQIQDTTYDLDKITDSIDLFDDVVKDRDVESKNIESKFRKEIGISDIGKSEVFAKVKTSIIMSSDFRNPKEFLKSFEQNSANALYGTMERVFKNPANLIKYRKAILESIPISTLIQMQKQLPEKIFIKSHGRATNKTILSDFVYGRNESGRNPDNKRLLPEEILNNSTISKKKRAQGVPVYERLETTTSQWESFINAPLVNPRTGKRSGTRGNNKIKILSESAIAIAKDATPEVLNREFVEKYIDLKGIDGITPQEVVKEINEAINRDPDLKFSSKSTVEIDEFLNVNNYLDIDANGKNVVLNMNKVGNAFDLKTNEGRKKFRTFIKDVLLPIMPREFWFGDSSFIGIDEIQKQITLMGDKFYKQYNLDIKVAKPLIDQAIKEPGKKNINIYNVIRQLNIQHWGTVFTPEHRPYGKFSMSEVTPGVLKNPKEARAYNEFRHSLRDLRNLPDENFGPPIEGISDFKVSAYSSIFKDKQTIEKGIEDGSIDRWNDKVTKIHEEMWSRFNQVIKENRENARGIATYLGLVANDTGHWHKLGARFIGYSETITGKRVEYEHAMPATAAYLYLLDSALKSNVNFDASYKFLMKNYTLIALDKAMDNKLRSAKTESGFSLQRRMNDNFSVIDGNWWERYFNAIVVAVDGIGIPPSSLIGLDGRTFEQIYKIKADGKPTGLRSSEKIKTDQNIADADVNSVKNSSKPRGMSTFDFDDTLGFTKSGVRATVPNPDGTPKPNRKVIFLAGGAGSGKGNVIRQLGLEGMGFKIVNSDISLEWLKKNSGLPADMRDLTKEQRSTLGKLGAQARKIARRKMMKYQGNANGVIVDGTGGSVKSMQKLVDEFKSKGYDVSMLFVDTSLDVALERNRARRERSLLDTIVKRNHEAVQNNKPTFKKMFGNRFMEVNTDNLTMQSPMPGKLVRQMEDFVSSYEKLRLDAAEFAEQGDAILEQGGEFDFSEFNDVVDGTPGPLLDKAKERAAKFGTKDMFVLTARPQQSAKAIHEFLKSQGLNIPIENITGLANSTGDAKAKWFLQKFAEGYNDMYFVDDALQNVEAVKQALDQLDIKSDVVQAKIKFSEKASVEFNEILERKKGVAAGKVFSSAEARKLASQTNIKRFLKSLYIPPSAEDFKGLLYYFITSGKQGEVDFKYLVDNLVTPFGKGIRAWNTYKQTMVEDFKNLKKKHKIKLNNNVPLTGLTVDTAVRVYLWNKNGFEIEGISDKVKIRLINHVNNNPEIRAFADSLSLITKRKDGYTAPSETWMLESISTDLRNIVDKIGRQEFLHEFIHNKNIIFSQQNINKIRAIYGNDFTSALLDSLFRMENGGNRPSGQSRIVSGFTSWINASIGSIMFFNTRSALLQTLSTVNFINWSDNNIFKASAAWANQPQFWKDFVMLFNSPMLKQRRSGLQTDVSAAELTKTFREGRATPVGVIRYLLQKGFLPTQVADSFAIAFGGASFYRNRYKSLIKKGMSPAQAHDQAMLDFQQVAEETQQSSREDLISQQQASVLGRFILAFQNVTMQYGRLTKKSLVDLINGRGDFKTNVSKILYYGAVQNIIFASLQSALAFLLFGDEDEELIDDKTERALNSALDSFLRGTGIYGALVSTLKNTIIQWNKQQEADFGKDRPEKIGLEILNLSPPIGSKLRKIYNAYYAEKYNKGVSEELGLRIENPEISKWANIVEGLTNIPLARLQNKANNLEEAFTGGHDTWKKVALVLGWSRWDIGIEDEELEAAKETAKTKRAEQKKIEKEEEKKKEEQRLKEEGYKTIRCSGIKSNGKRCSIMSQPTKDKKFLCYHHAAFTDGMDRDGDGIKEYRCTGIKKNGKRCKNKTENENKRCYAHQ